MIYFDHAATTPVHEEVLQRMYEFESKVFGNPSSIHAFGRRAKHFMENARKTIAQSIHASEKEIIFTSGGTEANNLAIIGTALANKHKGNHIITTKQEHQAVLQTMQYLASIGFAVTYLEVDPDGIINVDDLKNALTNETILVSIMMVNNETGMIQPIATCGELLKHHQAYFHTDAVQAYELIEIDVEQLGVDLLTTSAHKINGPKGIGFLYVKNDKNVNPIIFGGDQELKKRPGTENIRAIVGFEKAVQIMLQNRSNCQEQYRKMKQVLIQTLQTENIHFQLNGTVDGSVPSILNIHFPTISANILLTNLDLANIAVSSGSACTAGTLLPSHVLQAMYGMEDERAKQSIRISFGLYNTKEEVQYVANELVKIIKRIKR